MDMASADLIRYEEVQDALSVLEENRTLMDGPVFETAVAALRAQLAGFQSPKVTPMQQFDQVTVLVADIVGFTAMAQYVDAEMIRDRINAVFAKLDNVIVSWGGFVDKHIGDGIIALFGMNSEQEESAENAIQAALDMQLELALFNEQQQLNRGKRSTRNMVRMRIGVHCGQIFYGVYGTEQMETAVGDTVNTAYRLEELAPVDGILISHEVYRRVHTSFDVDLLDLGSNYSGAIPGRAYTITREKPHAFRRGHGQTSFLTTRFISRSDELHHLQQTMQGVIHGRQCRVVTVVGDAGIGKSRLLYEFERLLALQPEKFTVCRGGASRTLDQKPFSLFNEMLSTYFNIHRRHIPSVAKQKMVQGISQTLAASQTQSMTQAHFITHLLGYDSIDSPYLQDVINDPGALRRYAYQDLVQFFHALMAEGQPLLLLVEDTHLVDECSLNFLDYLIQESRDLPLMVVVLTQPSLFHIRPSWKINAELNPASFQQIDLQPLTLIESRHLLTELLPRVDVMPMRMVDFAITGANGNPLQLEELVSFLIAEKIIDTSTTNWLVRLGGLAEIATMTYDRMVKKRVQQLPGPAEMLLTTAALIGEFFWEETLQTLHPHIQEMSSLLEQLSGAGFIHKRTRSSYPQTREYKFTHQLLRKAVVEMSTPRARKETQRQIAGWFAAQQAHHPLPIESKIASLFQAAGDRAGAATWYGRAADEAAAARKPETALRFYRLALQQLPEQGSAAAEAVRYQQGLGLALLLLGQFAEAVELLTAVETAALQLGDNAGAISAQLSLARAFLACGKYVQAREYAARAQEYAAAMNDQEALLQAMVTTSWILLETGKIKDAVTLSSEIYETSKTIGSPKAVAFSRLLLGRIGRELGQFAQAHRALTESELQFQITQTPYWQIQTLLQHGSIAREQYQFSAALEHFRSARWLAFDTRHVSGTFLSLCELGRTQHLQGNFPAAEYNLQSAIAYAERMKQPLARVRVALELGELHTTQAVIPPMSTLALQEKETHLQKAYQWLREARKINDALKDDLSTIRILAGLAELALEEHLLNEAREQSISAIKQAEQRLQDQKTRELQVVTAISWRVLGMTLAKEPVQRNQINIGTKPISANSCFYRSEKLLQEVGDSVNHELAKTWRAWGIYRLFLGQPEKAKPMLEKAQLLFQACEMQWETEIIRQLL
jgi:class 3 adenylate cyclase/tetratricopeptide (TPR) repeat protein